MSGFLDVVGIEVPRSAVEEAIAHLREVGASGYEGFSLWAGKVQGQLFRVEQNIVPIQYGQRSPDGVCVRVGPEELHRVNVWLYQNGMVLIAQLHSHPTEAYHSDTDDAFPIATTVGSFSIVVPNYARGPFCFKKCAIYRLMPRRGWVFVDRNETERMFRILEDK